MYAWKGDTNFHSLNQNLTLKSKHCCFPFPRFSSFQFSSSSVHGTPPRHHYVDSLETSRPRFAKHMLTSHSFDNSYSTSAPSLYTSFPTPSWTNSSFSTDSDDEDFEYVCRRWSTCITFTLTKLEIWDSHIYIYIYIANCYVLAIAMKMTVQTYSAMWQRLLSNCYWTWLKPSRMHIILKY